MSAARTNLSSHDIRIGPRQIGEGEFREVLEGTYLGGNRNQQAAACKRFKKKYRHLSHTYFDDDFRVIDQTIDYAEAWNRFCPSGTEITIHRGAIHYSKSGIAYLVEPLIRYFNKYTSNSGWIGGEDNDWHVRAMTAFTHFTYHQSGNQHIVCDIQGQYRNNDRRGRRTKRFVLTDPAICSTTKSYGPTDLGLAGIESFFANHQCNEYCQSHWGQPYRSFAHFARTRGTTFAF